ncbi:unnamed protein product [Paramecium primaurelia]|uniref:Uncharacterized protein n=1 Tax=Paramecium primaurelia TaxID=5886 RepID=A0A8S1P7P8_PARPR|nr:unnamed protein product [Paramecium primaurelia]
MDPIFDLIQNVPFQRLMYIIIDKAHQIYQIVIIVSYNSQHRVHGQKLMRVNAPQGDSSILRPLKKLISDFQNSMAWLQFLKRIYDPKLFKRQSIPTLQRSLSTFHSLTISSVYKWLFTPVIFIKVLWGPDFWKKFNKIGQPLTIKITRFGSPWRIGRNSFSMRFQMIQRSLSRTGRPVSEGKFKDLNSEWMLGVGSRSKRVATGLGFTSLYKQTDGVSNIKLNYSALYIPFQFDFLSILIS